MSMPAAAARLLAYRPGAFLRGSAALGLQLVLRAAVLTVLFVLIARELGAAGFGAFSAVLALCALLAPFSGGGSSALLVRDAARRPELWSVRMGDVLRISARLGPPVALAAWLLAVLLLSELLPAHAIAALVLAEVICAPLTEVFARGWQALGHMGRMGLLLTGLPLARLLAFLALDPWIEWTPARWAFAYCAASVLYTAACGLWTLRRVSACQPEALLPGQDRPASGKLGRYRTLWRLCRHRHSHESLRVLLRQGFPFAFAAGAQRAQAEANKPILAHLTHSIDVGAYTAAQRCVDLLLLPLYALLETLLPRAYRAQRPVRAVLQLGTLPLCVALAGSGALFAAAPLLPVLLDESYASAVPIMRALALLPLFVTMRMLLTVLVAVIGNPRSYVSIYGLGALVSIVIGIHLIPHLGAYGAVIAAYSAEIIMILFQGASLVRTRCKYRAA